MPLAFRLPDILLHFCVRELFLDREELTGAWRQCAENFVTRFTTIDVGFPSHPPPEPYTLVLRAIPVLIVRAAGICFLNPPLPFAICDMQVRYYILNSDHYSIVLRAVVWSPVIDARRVKSPKPWCSNYKPDTPREASPIDFKTMHEAPLICVCSPLVMQNGLHGHVFPDLCVLPTRQAAGPPIRHFLVAAADVNAPKHLSSSAVGAAIACFFAEPPHPPTPAPQTSNPCTCVIRVCR